MKIAYSDRWPKTIGPITFFASKLWTHDDGRSDYALSVWFGKRWTLYCQVGKEWEFWIRKTGAAA